MKAKGGKKTRNRRTKSGGKSNHFQDDGPCSKGPGRHHLCFNHHAVASREQVAETAVQHSPAALALDMLHERAQVPMLEPTVLSVQAAIDLLLMVAAFQVEVQRCQGPERLRTEVALVGRPVPGLLRGVRLRVVVPVAVTDHPAWNRNDVACVAAQDEFVQLAFRDA